MSYSHEYRKNLVIGYLMLASIIALLIEGVYRKYIEAILKLVFTEEHSYLLVSFTTIVIVLHLSLKHIGFTYEVQVSRLLVSVFLALISIMLYGISELTVEYHLQVLGLSFATAIISIILLVFKPLTMSDAIPLLTPLLLIPIPTSFVDPVTYRLSRFIGRTAAFLTSTRYIDMGTFTLIEVKTKQSTYVFSVETACSGVLILSAVVVVLPVLAYYLALGREKVLRKLSISLLALLSGLAVGFTGDLVRMVAVIIIAKYHSDRLAMNVFRYPPSLLYASISVILIHLLISKLTRIKFIVPKPSTSRSGVPLFKWEFVSGVLVFSLAIALLMQSLALAVTSINNIQTNSITVEISSLEEFARNPATYIFKRNTLIVKSTYDDFLTKVSGALVAYWVNVLVENNEYYGLLEIVDVPARLHTLQLCMGLHGFKILNSWSESMGPLQVSYIVMEKNSIEYVMSYTLIPVIVKTPGAEYTIYLRASLFKLYRGVTDLESTGRVLVSILNVDTVSTIEPGKTTIYVLGVAGVSLFILLAIYVLMVCAYKYISLTRRRVSL